jgi:hypothetical protein
MPLGKINWQSLFELAEQGTLDGASLQVLFEQERLDDNVLLAVHNLLLLGPEWSDQRWPVDPNVRVLPTLTNDVLGLESWVPYGEGWEIPAGFEYNGHGPFDWSIWVQVIDGKAECLAVRAWAAGERPITAEGFRRLPLGRLLHQAVLVVSRPADEIPKRNEPWESVEAARRARTEVTATHKRSKRSPRDRRPITDETLREVADIYRVNLTGGAPTRAVAETLNYSRASAGRLVMEARRRGLLPQTEPRKARG